MQCITLAAVPAKHGGPLYENPNIFLPMLDCRSHYRRAIILLFYLDYETMIYAILATLLRLLKK